MSSITRLIVRKGRAMKMQQILARLRTLLNRRFQGEDRVTLLSMINALERISEERSIFPASMDLEDEDSSKIDRLVEEKLQQLEDHLSACTGYRCNSIP